MSSARRQSSRSTKGQPPLRYKDYDTKFTKMDDNNDKVGQEDGSSSETDSLNNINDTLVDTNNVEVPCTDNISSLVEGLMERLKLLEGKQRETEQQLKQSNETNKLLRSQLESQVSSGQVPNSEAVNNNESNNMSRTTPVSQHNDTSSQIFNCPTSTFTPSATQPHFLETNVNLNSENERHIRYFPEARKLYDLPEFSGRPEEWPVFITTFRESTDAYKYTLLENTFRLQKSLKGLAREEVECLMINPQNVPRVLEQLEFKFGRPELLVKSQLERLKEIVAIPENHLERLVSFSSKVQSLAVFFENIKASHYLSNPTLIEDLVNKLPMSKKIEWTAHSMNLKPYPTLLDFNKWLSQIAKVVAKATVNMPQSNVLLRQPANQRNSERNNARPVLAVNDPRRRITCFDCNGEHFIWKCNSFINKNVNQRWDIVKEKHLCFSCLSKGHGLKDCRKKRVCHVDGCRNIHNPLLHKDDQLINQNNQVNTDQVRNVRVNTVEQSGMNSPRLLYKILPVEFCGSNDKVVNGFVFLDEGSSTTLIDEALAKQLNVKGEQTKVTLQWFGGNMTQVESSEIILKVRGMTGSRVWNDLKGITVPNLDLPSQSVKLSELHDKYKGLKGLPIHNYNNASPSVLIGLDNCHLTRNLKGLSYGDCLIAAKTPLGWVIYGKAGCGHLANHNVLHIGINNEDNLNSLVSDYFTTENFGVKVPEKPLESDDILRARIILENTTKRIDNRYQTGLLWKNENVTLPNSYDMAVRRFLSLESKMKQDKEFAQQYVAAMEDYILKGFAKKLTFNEAQEVSGRTWYLPHFPVYNVNKPGKVRIVFDAAACVDGISLNSVLLKGPDDNQPLMKILMRFREKPIGLCADIKEMFMQIRIREDDQCAQRFLWRRDSNDLIDTYVMTAMIFGSTSSPCSAQYVKNKNAREEAFMYPDVVSAIEEGHYVDDFVYSFRNEEEALDVTRKVIETHLKASFILRGFVSNSKYVEEQLNERSKEIKIVNMKASSTVDKILGLFWNSSEDEFVFKLSFNRIDKEILNCVRIPTKREFLSLVMSVYDPFGMLANILIYGKCLLQEVWQSGVQWDQQIPKHIFDKFSHWLNEMKSVENYRIPRCYSSKLLSPNTKIELHIFVDASQVAFATVAFWRIVDKDSVDISFVAGKTKCAPLKVISIPRLELQAAVLGVRLKSAILEYHKVQPSKIFFWSDSTTVISWINSDHRQYKQFVAHRVGEILESSHKNQWKWLPSKLNVADEATRTNYPINYDANGKWSLGPSFLKGNEEMWPKMAKITQVEVERRHVNLIGKFYPLFEYTRFSSYLRLLRTCAWVVRFKNRCQSKALYNTRELTAEEMNCAELLLVRLVQNEVYPEEIQQLRSRNAVDKTSSLFSLSPQLDDNGLLCVHGRLDNAMLVSKFTRNPLVLPYKHPFTQLIIEWYHNKFYHQNTEIVINELRRKFWIPHIRAAVKNMKSRCLQCKFDHVQPKIPMMGQLPKDRVTPYVRPFSYTGIDYFGPMAVTIGRRSEKRWAALFTCLTTRAIHIELATDLSTDACILCIRNFINRRGIPVKIRSDMGTNFVGTDGEIRKVKGLFDYDYIQQELAIKRIEWEFNCPANPSSGGCWERLIRSVKRVLSVTLKEKAPQVETLRSLLIEAENIVNSRPLTYIPVTPENPEPLTPNHFLIGTLNSTQTPADIENIFPRKQYRIAQQLKNCFWRRWLREYLPTLTRRTKWCVRQEPLKVNDLVLIVDENMPRSQWRRGRTLKVYPAKDGQVRFADIQTSTGILRRPTSKLAVLDVLGEAPRDLHGGGNVAAKTIS